MTTLQSASRVVRALEHLASHGPARLDEVAAVLDVHKSNALRLLTTLREHGWVVTDDTRSRYSVGPRLIAIGEAAVGGLELQKALALAEDLRNLTGETVHVSIPQGDRMLVVGRADSTNPLRVTWPVGAEDLLHASAVGKAYLATLSEDDLTDLVARLDMVPLTSYTVTSPHKLLEEIALTRQRGYALNEEEGRLGVASVAVAVRFSGFTGVVSISVTAPSTRMDKATIEDLLPSILEVVEPYRAI